MKSFKIHSVKFKYKTVWYGRCYNEGRNFFSGLVSGKQLPDVAYLKASFLNLIKMGRTLLEPGCAYHIYNHAVGKDRLFVNDDNYLYFLKRFQYFIPPVADTYAYCLMSNHIHLLVTIKDEILIPENSVYTAERFVSKQFSNLFSSYSQAFNKQQQRMGNLFISNFKRRKIGRRRFY